METIFLRFGITFLLSIIFGLERQRSHKPAGLATFVFVAIGSCSLSLIAVTMGKENPLPLLAAAVTGIGFLGAGALIKTADKIFGFSTAAGIWLFAILGLTIGAGEFFMAGIVYALIWVTVIIDNFFEHHSIGLYQKKLTIHTTKIIDEKTEIFPLLSRHKVISIDVDKQNNKLTLIFLIEGSKRQLSRTLNKLYDKDWFGSFKLE